VTPDPTLQLSRDNRSGPLYRVHTDRPTVLSIGYSTHREEYLLSGGKTLATLKIFLTQARQVVSSDPLGAKHYVDRALALLSHTPASAKSPDTDTVQSGGLAAWQTRRAQSMIEAQLGERLLIAELASAVRLSPSHFARAFKRSVGCSPHHYMLKRRIERAKEQMRTSDTPLAQIAVECGFSDQSHFTRCFKRCEGETPTAWHRRVASRTPRSYAPAMVREAVPA